MLFFAGSQMLYLPMNINWAYLETCFLRGIRLDIYRKTMRLSAYKLNDLKTGEIVSMMSTDVEAIMTYIVRNFFQQISNFVVLIISCGYIFSENKTIGVLVVLFIPVNYFIGKTIKNKIEIMFQMLRNDEMENKSFILDLLQMLKEISVFNLFGEIEHVYLKKERNICVIRTNIEQKEVMAEQIKELFSLVVKLLIFFCVFKNMNITIGIFVACMEYYEKANIVFGSIIKKQIDGYKNMKSITRVRLYLLQDEESIGDKMCPEIRKIKIQKMSFSYGTSIILKSVSCEFNRGEVIAIIGESGEGISTMVDLLYKLIYPKDGKILVNDRLDINEINTFSYHEKVAILFQNNMLLNDSIKNNLTEGMNVEEDNIIEILKKENMDQYILNLPKGLDCVMEGFEQELSVGQARRICLARCLLKNPQVLVLDEPTASVDLETTQLIIDNCLENSNRITIIVTHDRSIIEKADRVFRLINGNLELER